MQGPERTPAMTAEGEAGRGPCYRKSPHTLRLLYQGLKMDTDTQDRGLNVVQLQGDGLLRGHASPASWGLVGAEALGDAM